MNTWLLYYNYSEEANVTYWGMAELIPDLIKIISSWIRWI